MSTFKTLAGSPQPVFIRQMLLGTTEPSSSWANAPVGR